LTILSKPNRPKASLVGLRMASPSSCKNFRFFGQPSENFPICNLSRVGAATASEGKLINGVDRLVIWVMVDEIAAKLQLNYDEDTP
jgi:hypothetical protein